jgi:hypothetical protein
MDTANIEKKEYSKSELVFGNLAIIFWIGLGAVSVGLFYPLASLAFIALAAFLIFFELGKHGCITCYYCKTCTIGMGKLPELFFKQGGTANVNRSALRLFPFVYVLLSIFPIFLVAFSMVQEMRIYKVALLAALLMFSLYTGTVRRKNLTI